MENISYVAMDVHKKNIVVAESRSRGEGEVIGEYPNDEAGVRKLIKKLNKISEEKNTLKLCYEAGPCGYALKRVLEKKGYSCEIIAPSLIPTKSGERIKTDKRDAKKLAKLYRAGELTFVVVPDEQKEAVRDLVRCRTDFVEDISRAKQRANQFLIRHGYHFEGTNWTLAYRTWARQIKFEDKNLNIVLSQYMDQITRLELQLKDIDKELEKLAQTEEYKDKVEALCAFKGIKLTSAMVIISEIVDFRRFENPTDLMAYLGLVPSEYSSGGKQTKGSITKCGNSRVRKVLTEAAWNVRFSSITKSMQKDLEKLDPQLRVPPINGLRRLSKRFRYLLVERGKMKQKVIVAIARELVGFIWDSMVIIETRKQVNQVLQMDADGSCVPLKKAA